MKEELITLIKKAKEAIDSLENFLFTEHREFYIISKSRIDSSKTMLGFVEDHLDKLTDEELNAALQDITKIIASIDELRTKYANPDAPNNASEFSEEELNGLLNNLNNADFGELLTGTEQAIETLNAEPTPVAEPIPTDEPMPVMEPTLADEPTPAPEPMPTDENFELKDFPDISVDGLESTPMPTEQVVDVPAPEQEPVMTTAFANDSSDMFRL